MSCDRYLTHYTITHARLGAVHGDARKRRNLDKENDNETQTDKTMNAPPDRWIEVAVQTPAHSGVGDLLTYRSPQPVVPGQLVRVPLGRREVLGMVVAQGMRPAAIGIAIGTAIALALRPHDLRALDPAQAPLRGQVLHQEFLGGSIRLHVRVGQQTLLLDGLARDLPPIICPGGEIGIGLDGQDLLELEAAT